MLANLESIIAPKHQITLGRQVILLLECPVGDVVEGDEYDFLVLMCTSHLKSPTFSAELLKLEAMCPGSELTRLEAVLAAHTDNNLRQGSARCHDRNGSWQWLTPIRWDYRHGFRVLL